jgi:hypothetical protein
MVKSQIGDLDEFWMPKTLPSKIDQSSKPLIDVLRTFKGSPKCPDWCYITFPSYSIFRIPLVEDTPAMAAAATAVPIPQTTRSSRVIRISEAFPFRVDNLNDVWKKSIARTKNVFQSGCKYSVNIIASFN